MAKKARDIPPRLEKMDEKPRKIKSNDKPVSGEAGSIYSRGGSKSSGNKAGK